MLARFLDGLDDLSARAPASRREAQQVFIPDILQPVLSELLYHSAAREVIST